MIESDKPVALRQGLADFLKEFEANADLSNVRDVLTKCRAVLGDELYNVSLPFWLKNALDQKGMHSAARAIAITAF